MLAMIAARFTMVPELFAATNNATTFILLNEPYKQTRLARIIIAGYSIVVCFCLLLSSTYRDELVVKDVTIIFV